MGDCRPAGEARGDRRRRIVAAASRLFSEHVYADVQMDDVARAAAVAKPTLYRYFPSKENLFLAAMAEVLDGLETRVAACNARAPDAHEALAQAVAIVLEAFGRCGYALSAIDAEAHVPSVSSSGSSLGDRARAVLRSQVGVLRASFLAILSRGIAEGHFAPLDPELTVNIVLGAIRLSAVKVDPARRDEAATLIGAVLGRGLALPSIRTAAA